MFSDRGLLFLSKTLQACFALRLDDFRNAGNCFKLVLRYVWTTFGMQVTVSPTERSNLQESLESLCSQRTL